MFSLIRNLCNSKIVVLKGTTHRATRYKIVSNNSDREIVLGFRAVEVHYCVFLSKKVASYADVINNVSASISNIAQDNDGDSTDSI